MANRSIPSPKSEQIAALMVVQFVGFLQVAAIAQPLPINHWAMEPPTSVATELDSELAPLGFETDLVDFPGDGTEWVVGMKGRALSFDGATQHAEHTYALPRTAGTIGHWLRPADASEQTVAVYESDFAGRGGSDYNGFGSAGDALEIHTGLNDGNYFVVWQDGAPETTRQVRAGEAVTGQWSHVAVTWSVPGNLTLYVDCVAVGSVALDATFADRTPTEHLIGRPSEFLGRHWHGEMDDVQIWPWEYSASEVRAHFCPGLEFEQQALKAESPTASGRFGFSVAMDGDWLLVRSPGTSEVHWYERSGPADFQFHSTASASPMATPDDELHRSVALDGTLSLVRVAGAVNLLELGHLSPDEWGLVQSLGPEFDDFGDFGRTVALSGDRLVLGSPRTNGGALYIYEPNGPGSWARTLYRPSITLDRFTQLVDVDGDLVATLGDIPSGTPGYNGTIVTLFRRDLGGVGAWGTEKTLEINMIKSFALRGDRIAVASIGSNARGVVEIYGRDIGGVDQWGREHILYATDADYLDGLGFDVVWLDDETVAASALGSPKDHQAIYVFRLGDTEIQAQHVILLQSSFDPVAESSGSMGFSLAGIHDLLVAGAPFTGTAIAGPAGSEPVDSGRVHVFVPPLLFANGFESGDTSRW